MNQPLSVDESILLINSLLKGSDLVPKYEEFLSKRKLGAKKKNLVGRHYWQLFLRRNKNIIKTLTGTKLDQTWHKWTTFDNFSKMYDLVYALLRESGIA